MNARLLGGSTGIEVTEFARNISLWYHGAGPHDRALASAQRAAVLQHQHPQDGAVRQHVLGDDGLRIPDRDAVRDDCLKLLPLREAGSLACVKASFLLLS